MTKAEEERRKFN